MSIVEFLSQPLWQRLGLTLVHFLWQGLAIAVLVGTFVRVFRLNHGNARYAAYLLAFAAMIACPVVTFTVIDIPISPNTELVTGAESAEVVDNVSYTALPAGDILPEAETSSAVVPGATAATDSIPLRERISDWLNVSMPWVLVIWMVGVIVLSVRLLVGFVGVYRWRHNLEPLPERLAQRVASLTERLCMRGFSRVFISPTVLQAMAVGYLRPMVLLPAAMITQMQIEMLEAVIAHELAHIRRFDLWVNLAQRVTETLLFYHPAVWWLSNCLRSERELCCDELAVKATGERITYASTLENVGRARFMAKQPILATGLGQDNKPTLGRVRHILGLRPTQRNCPFWLAGVITVLFLAALVIPTTLALTNQSDEKLSLNVETADGLPVGWKLDYDDGTNSIGSEKGIGSEEGKGGRHWRSDMAEDLAELVVIPTPANEYDESWKEERIYFEINSLSGKHVGGFHFLPNTVGDRMVLAPGKYVLSYTRGAVDLKSNCTIPLDSTKFEVDLSGAGMYQLKFTPKLKDSGTVISDKYPPTTCKGKVIDVNGNQLGRIKVAAYEMFFNMAGGLDMRLIGEAVTKADGAFVFETRPSVKKSKSMGGIVMAQKEGLSVGWADWPLFGEQKVTITSGKPAKMAGFVVDENGKGIANAKVRAVLFKKKTSENEKTKWLPGIGHLRWLTVRTDREGQFEFNNIPQDIRADFVISAAGFSTIYTHKPENLSAGYEGAEFIAGQTDIRVELTTEGRIEGKVIDSKSGQGVAGVKLAVVPTFSPFFFERFLCISRENGTFTIGGLQSGEYLIRGDFPKVYANVKSGQKTDVQVEGREVGAMSVIRAVDNKATLGSGLTVELLGLTEIPIKDNPWWKPNGSLIEQPPFDNVSNDPSRDPNHDQFTYYAIAMKLNGKTPDKIGLIKWDFTDALYAGTTSAYLGDKGVYKENIHAAAARFPKDVENTTLRLGIAGGDWETLVAGRHYGFYRKGEDTIVVRTPERAGGPFGVRPQEKGLHISVTYNITDRDFRVVAVDKDGKVHFSSRGGSSGTDNLRRTTASFSDLTRDKLQEYRFQTRRYEWVEFKDISLRPGKEAIALAEKRRAVGREELEKWLGQGQTRRIREQILVLRGCRIFQEMETWASAIRELVSIGKPAVPELLAELRRAQRWPARSTIAFTLRAIGDRRAVAVLIEVLGRAEYRGEYGIHLKDPPLSVFMLENQHRPNPYWDGKQKDPQITIGCPIIEITAALEKITGHSEGHEHYGHKAVAELGSDAPREVVNRRIQEIVREVASRWQKWWDHHKTAVQVEVP